VPSAKSSSRIRILKSSPCAPTLLHLAREVDDCPHGRITRSLPVVTYGRSGSIDLMESFFKTEATSGGATRALGRNELV